MSNITTSREIILKYTSLEVAGLRDMYTVAKLLPVSRLTIREINTLKVFINKIDNLA